MSNITGNWDLLSVNGNLISYWQFKENGEFLETANEIAVKSNNTGTWELNDGMVVIKYANKEIGFSVLSFEDTNTLVGENRHENGDVFDLVLRRVEEG